MAGRRRRPGGGLLGDEAEERHWEAAGAAEAEAEAEGGGAHGDGGDLYAVLNVPRDASEEEVQRAYRTLARTCHPDKHQDPALHAAAAASFQRLNEVGAPRPLCPPRLPHPRQRPGSVLCASAILSPGPLVKAEHASTLGRECDRRLGSAPGQFDKRDRKLLERHQLRIRAALPVPHSNSLIAAGPLPGVHHSERPGEAAGV